MCNQPNVFIFLLAGYGAIEFIKWLWYITVERPRERKQDEIMARMIKKAAEKKNVSVHIVKPEEEGDGWEDNL